MSFLSSIRNYFEKPVIFSFIGKHMKPGITYLDVGCGDRAPYSTYRYYPNIAYTGIDNRDIAGAKDMEQFLKCDIENNDLTEIPNDTYNVINLSHIIEHIDSGDNLLQTLAKKLKKNGIIYVETPSERSLKLPSFYGTLNFWDDTTHKKVYSIKEMENALTLSGCTILKSGIRHNIKKIIFLPLIRDKKISATLFWDIVGFAHYVIAKKN